MLVSLRSGPCSNGDPNLTTIPRNVGGIDELEPLDPVHPGRLERVVRTGSDGRPRASPMTGVMCPGFGGLASASRRLLSSP